MGNNLTSNETITNTTTRHVPSESFTLMSQMLFYFALFLIVVALVKIASNTVLLVVLGRDPLKTFRNTTRFLLVALSVTTLTTGILGDFITAVCLLIMRSDLEEMTSGGLSVDQLIQVLTGFQRTVAAVTISLGFTTILWKVSILTVFVFTVVQLLVIASPLRYGKGVTKRRVQWSLAIIWIYSLLTSTIVTRVTVADTVESNAINGHYRKHITVLNILDTCLHFCIIPYLTILVYIFVYRTFRHKVLQGLALRSENVQQLEKEKKKQQSQRKSLIINVLLIVSMFLFTQPAAVSSIIIIAIPSSVLNESVQSYSFIFVSIFGIGLLSVKQVLDTVVFAWRLPQFRKAVKMLFLKRNNHAWRSLFIS